MRAISALHELVADARSGEPETWSVGPIVARDVERFSAIAHPALYLTAVLEWGSGPPPDQMRPDGLSSHESPFAGDRALRAVHGGQQLTIHRALDGAPVDEAIQATRVVEQADVKSGRSGSLAVLSLCTRFVGDVSGPLVTCRESVVYRAPVGAPATPVERPAPSIDPATPCQFSHRFGPVELLRFSAVTWNTHRIHVDTEFARSEGFDGPVVQSSLHGATLLAAAVVAADGERSVAPVVREFGWRNLAPAVAGQRIRAAATPAAGGWDAVAWTDDGVVTSRGHTSFRA